MPRIVESKYSASEMAAAVSPLHRGVERQWRLFYVSIFVENRRRRLYDFEKEQEKAEEYNHGLEQQRGYDSGI